MASVAALNVRIGGDIKALEKALKDAERAVRTAGTRLSAIGNELSMKLTLPILAFGAAAIKSAGEIEAIEKAMQATFQGAGRSIEEANAELVALRKAAEAPGLDFEQAVKASLRLQGVGFSAEKARNTIIQLANAISTTGGTAENLNGVTVQFAQIISKGKILTSDLNVIKENMPGLAKIMKETFGTTSAEDLRALGVNGQEFVEKITAAMQKLPRVEGGISNAIVNAGVAIKMFLANVGESLNKTFNVTGKLEAFSSFLSGIGEKFSNMSEGTQRAITAVGVFALALGPMLKVGQFAVLAIGQMIAVFGALQKVLLQSLAGQAIPGAIAAFKALDVATKLTIVGAAIGVVLALAAAFTVLRKDTSDAAKAQEQLGIVETMASNSVAEQMTRVNILTNALKSNVTSLDTKKRALVELNQIAPEYFGKLKLGTDIVDQATAAQNAYRESLMKTARVQAATEQLVALEKELNSLAQNSSATTMQTLANVLTSGGSATKFFSEQAQTLGDNFEKSKTTIEAQKRVLLDLITTNQGVAASTKNATTLTDLNTDATDKNTKAKKEQNAEWEKYMKWVHEVDMAQKKQDYKDVKDSNKPFKPLPLPAFQKTADGENANPVKSEEAINKLEERLSRVSGKVKKAIQAVADGTATSQQKLIDWADKFQEKIGEWPEKIQEGIGAITGLSDAISARNISNLNKEMEERLKGVKKGSAEEVKIKEEFQSKIEAIERKAARRAKALAILEATITAAQGVLKGLAKGSLPGAIAAGALGAIQIARIIATPLAKGTNNFAGGTALVGEIGPELVTLPSGTQVTPHNKLQGMLRESGGSQRVEVFGTLNNGMILLATEKAQKERGRVAGY